MRGGALGRFVVRVGRAHHQFQMTEAMPLEPCARARQVGVRPARDHCAHFLQIDVGQHFVGQQRVALVQSGGEIFVIP